MRMTKSEMTEFAREQAVATMLDVSLATLRRWRLFGKGPKYLKLGGLVRYRHSDLNSWLASRPCGGDLRPAA